MDETGDSMRARSHRTTIVLGIWIILALLLPAAISLASQSSMRPTVYLPLVLSVPSEPPPTPSPQPWPSPIPTPQPALPSSVFGLVMTGIRPERGLDGALEAGIAWIRSDNNLLWRDVEPIEGAGYQWSAPSVQRVEQEMIRASQNNLKLIVIVRAHPRWATAPYKTDCAPINPSKYTRFAAFLAAAVARYSQPPYNVLFWQVGNEPDANIEAGFGCWGIKTDPYYGGRAYGEMLKVVYPAMKAANPAVQVLHGSLLLNTAYHPEISNSVSGRFIEGVFLAGAANSFDILAYNAYAWGNNLNGADWKTPYLRGLMTTYQVPLKPMLITEQALLCDPACPKLQAYAVGRYYARALGSNLLGSLWYIYDSDGFHNTALVEPSNILQRRPAYYAYKYAATLLSGASSLGPLTDQPSGVEGYRFAQGRETLIVLWSNKAQGVAIPVDPNASVTCTGWDGAALPCSNEAGLVQLTADLGTIYVIAR
jgi:hypothetical protein